MNLEKRKHAYLIMAHNEIQQLYLLLQCLDFENNDIYIHIDKKVKNVDFDQLKAQVVHSKIFFIDRINVHWGHASIVKCELNLLKAAYKNGPYHYYHLTSGVDLPLKPQQEIHEMLKDGDIEYIAAHENGEYKDYFLKKIDLYYPLIGLVGRGGYQGRNKKERLLIKLGEYQWRFEEWQIKHNISRTRNKNVIYYKGDQWFSITNELVEYILKNERSILKRYKLTNAPDEIFLPTLAMNSDFKEKVSGTTMRHVDWTRGFPYEFKLDDLKELKETDDWFARKISFEHSPQLVDNLLGNPTSVEGTPLISVIVPIYNVAPYIGKCLASIGAQTYDNFEVILVDDGSTDEGGIIALEYSKRDPRFKYIKQENKGLSEARNAGIDKATGEYLAFIDSDDWIEPDYLEKLFEGIAKTGADVAVCGFYEESQSPRKVVFDNFEVLSKERSMEAFSNIFTKENLLMTLAWNKLYHKKIFKELRYTPGVIHEDEFIAHRIVNEAHKITVIPEVMYHYETRDDSITGSKKTQDVRHLVLLDAQADRVLCCKNALYQNIFTNIVYSYFENITMLCMRYDEDSFKQYKLNRLLRKYAFREYVRDGHLLPRGYKRDVRKMIINPYKYKKYIERKITNKKDE